ILTAIATSLGVQSCM
ncbi:MAG: smalltalk protein, partial [Prevotella sp.]|nr:smalltalk protein [Prevotella sp.]